MQPDYRRTALDCITKWSRVNRQFQKRIRLQEARLRLLASPGDVAVAGHAVGYESISQFSCEYRRLFGLPPGRDAARLRAEEHAAV